MKHKVFTLLIVLTMLMAVFVGSASAQAYNASFTTSITYLNVGQAATTTLELLFYANPGDVAPTSFTLPSLGAGAASSLFIGSLGEDIVPAGFKGDAVMQSDQPMLVTLVQIPMTGGGVVNRGLSNGFSVGGEKTFVATFLKEAPVATKTNTIFSVQNADSVLNSVAVTFYDQSANPVLTINQDIEAGASYYVDAGQVTGLASGFSGSAIVTATRSGGGAGSIVSGIMELDTISTGVRAFEGVAAGAMLFYMPSALCNYIVSGAPTNTSYAVQNVGGVSTDVTVTFKDTSGNPFPVTKTIGPGAKASFGACEAGGLPGGTLGSAVVSSTASPVIAIGKAYGAGLSTAFNGVPAGNESVALPYVRWADTTHWNAGTHQRTYITIQNVGDPIPEGTNILIKYNDPNGVTVATHTYTVGAGGLANGQKFNSTPQAAGLDSFGYWNNYTTAGGAAVIVGPAGSELAAVARVSTQVSAGNLVSEDYNSQALP